MHGIQIGPRTYWAHLSGSLSKRALCDAAVAEILAEIYEPDARDRRPPEPLHSSLKMWAHAKTGHLSREIHCRAADRGPGWYVATRARKATGLDALARGSRW